MLLGAGPWPRAAAGEGRPVLPGPHCLPVPAGSIWKAPRVFTCGGTCPPLLWGTLQDAYSEAEAAPLAWLGLEDLGLWSLGAKDPHFPQLWGQQCPLSTLTVHSDHSFQGADGVEVGFLLPAFF